MIRDLFNKLIPRPEGTEDVETPRDVVAHFTLWLDDLEVGQLWHEEGLWHFEYSAPFRDQSEIKPLVGFPDLARHYVSGSLWPFFSVRIPSMAQPTVRRIVDHENIDGRNEADLLRRFGAHTISNPFRLEAAAAA